MSRSAVVIEDDIRIGELVRLLLEKCGFQVVLERDGADGLKRLQGLKPDLVMTDMLLPGLHGLDICRAIRSDPSLRHVKIIAMTAIFRSRQFQLDARGVRFDALLEKPFDIHAVSRVVRDLFPDTCVESEGGKTALNMDAPSDSKKQAEAFADQLLQLQRRWEQYRSFPERRQLLEEMLNELGSLTGMTAFQGERAVSELFAEMKQVIQGFLRNRGAVLESEANRLDRSFALVREFLGVSVPEPVPTKPVGRKETAPVEKTTSPSAAELLVDRPYRNICLISDEPERFDHLSKGLGVFGYRLIRTGWAEDGGQCSELHAILIDLRSFMKEPDPQRLSHVEQVRRQVGEDIPAVVITEQPQIEDRILQELVQHGCWDFHTGASDAFGVVSHLERTHFEGEATPERLLIADDQSLSEYVQIILKAKGFLTETVRSVAEVRSTVEAFRPDLVLVGEGLGRLTAIGLIRFLRSMDADLPIVLLAESADADLIQSVSDAGCSDMLPLGLAEDRMTLTLRSRMRTFHSIRHRRDYDNVTGALHFSEWLVRLERDRKWALKHGAPFLCASIQLDNLADMNRQYGELFSDRLLKALVHLLKHRFRNRAVVGRDGAGRFNVFIGELGSRDAETLWNGYTQYFSSIPFRHSSGTVQVRVSVGVAMCRQQETTHQLLKRAVRACGRAQVGGGNAVVMLEK